MQFAGLIIVVIGLALVAIPLALIVGGVMISVLGYLREMSKVRENDHEGTSDAVA
jgi:hypothetical protein